VVSAKTITSGFLLLSAERKKKRPQTEKEIGTGAALQVDLRGDCSRNTDFTAHSVLSDKDTRK
jgi:hypothetical protein